eukprot:GHVQ01037475.1.p1 GENE.GHVQ01037475.1~~GHVQ01037475.1.p1  ORF type:complete len:666 (-),score=54.93 GHVQ01037475.1:232-2229(-)
MLLFIEYLLHSLKPSLILDVTHRILASPSLQMLLVRELAMHSTKPLNLSSIIFEQHMAGGDQLQPFRGYMEENPQIDERCRAVKRKYGAASEGLALDAPDGSAVKSSWASQPPDIEPIDDPEGLTVSIADKAGLCPFPPQTSVYPTSNLHHAVSSSGYPGVSWNKRMRAWLAFFYDGSTRRSRTFSPKNMGGDVEAARLAAIAFMRSVEGNKRRTTAPGRLRALSLPKDKRSETSRLHQSHDYFDASSDSSGVYPPESFSLQFLESEASKKRALEMCSDTTQSCFSRRSSMGAQYDNGGPIQRRSTPLDAYRVGDDHVPKQAHVPSAYKHEDGDSSNMGPLKVEDQRMLYRGVENSDSYQPWLNRGRQHGMWAHSPNGELSATSSGIQQRRASSGPGAVRMNSNDPSNGFLPSAAPQPLNRLGSATGGMLGPTNFPCSMGDTRRASSGLTPVATSKHTSFSGIEGAFPRMAVRPSGNDVGAVVTSPTFGCRDSQKTPYGNGTVGVNSDTFSSRCVSSSPSTFLRRSESLESSLLLAASKSGTGSLTMNPGLGRSNTLGERNVCVPLDRSGDQLDEVPYEQRPGFMKRSMLKHSVSSAIDRSMQEWIRSLASFEHLNVESPDRLVGQPKSTCSMSLQEALAEEAKRNSLLADQQRRFSVANNRSSV